MLVADMFTGEWTQPEQTTDASAGFDTFWKQWPAGPRKVGKPQALQKWIKHKWADSSELIIAHVAWMRTQGDWLKDGGAYIPMVLTYLNQQRWVDWTPPAKTAMDPAQATRALLAERDKGYRPPSAEIRAKLESLKTNKRSIG